ncbi:MAG: iron ABC transporter permease [Thermomicrobiales bacterium]
MIRDHAVDWLDDLTIRDAAVSQWRGFSELPGASSMIGWLDGSTDRFRTWLTPAYTPRDESVIWDIRVPRVFLGAVVGGLIALAATLIQAVFRNPLADPGLTGVSAGGALAALLMTFVSGWSIAPGISGDWNLRISQPLAASMACFLVLGMLWFVSQRQGSIDSLTFVLTGVAINAVLIAGIGLTNAVNGDVLQQATSFWATGGLSQATWYPVQMTFTVLLVSWIATLRLGALLNVLALSDREAEHLGVRVGLVRFSVVVLAAILLGFAAAYAGATVFVGLIVPQMMRLWHGPDLRHALPQSVMGGAIVVVMADLIARSIAQPMEVGLGLILTLIGGPVFVLLLLQMRRRAGGWL